MAGFEELALDLLNSLLSNTSASPGASGVIVLSIALNCNFYSQIKSLNSEHKKYLNWLKNLEPILTKILNKEKLTKADIEDLKYYRQIIKMVIE